MPFKIIEHTADVRLLIQGHTEEELFQNAVAGVMHVVKRDVPKKPPVDFEKVQAEGGDVYTLLINFLNEVLAQTQIKKKIYGRVKFLRFSVTGLEAQVFGALVESFDEDVKAVTYHGGDIKRNARGILQTEIVLDI